MPSTSGSRCSCPDTSQAFTSDTTGFGSQASVAVGGVNAGVAGQLIVPLGPATDSVGAVSSLTLIVWLAVLVLPQASFAVHVRVTEYF